MADVQAYVFYWSLSSANVILLTLVATLTCIGWYYTKCQRKNLPPGPWGLPIVGYIPFMSRHPHETFAELAEKYGSVFSLYLGNRLVVVLGTYETIREAIVKQGDNFSGRPTFSLISSRKLQLQGINLNEGESWRQYRRFSLATLRDFGLGTMNIEPRIKEEVGHFLEALEATKGKPSDVDKLIRLSVSNVICSIIFGARFEYDDPTIQQLLLVLKDHVQRTQLAGTLEFLPWLSKIPGVVHNKLMSETAKELHIGIQKKINQHVEDYKSGSQRDFIDAWITEGERLANEDHHIRLENLVAVLRSLFIAGSDTTATTLRWSLLYMMKHNNVQERVYKEINDVVGQERTPSLMDRNNMNYTEAVLAEVQRISTIVPLAITHSNFEEAEIFGYTIPKRSVIMPNLWAVHHDPQFFPKPNEFLPERFLDENGKLKKIEQYIPFSLGKRQCLGEALAKAELFLYFTSMVQRFELKKSEGAELCFDYVYSAISVPEDYEVCAIPRKA